MSHVRPFKLSERDVWPGCREIEVEGEIDVCVHDRLRVALERAASEGRHVLLDLGACEFIDAGGLTALIRAQRELGARGRQLLLYGLHGQVRRIVVLTGMAASGLLIAGDFGKRKLPPLGSLTLKATGDGSFRLSVDGEEVAPHRAHSGTWAP